MSETALRKEAKRLYDLGFAVHWIKEKSKAPVKKGWSGPVRDKWNVVNQEYQKGYGLGVRMGQASQFPDGTFLANIDVDIKSAKTAHRKEALAFLEKTFPGLMARAPIVTTGYGLRLFIRTKTPIASVKLFTSPDETLVHLPTAEVNRRQLKAIEDKKLSRAQLDKGWRIRAAWELELMSEGKQVVLPPSIHPETNKPYAWQKGIEKFQDIPLIDCEGFTSGKTFPGRPVGTMPAFKPVEVDLICSNLSDRVVEMIEDGTGVTNRSDAVYSATLAMVKANFSDDEILSVLTDRRYFLGEVAYEHRKTKSRASAAGWVRDYGLRKARDELDITKVFADDLGETPLLESDEAVKQQTKKLTASKTQLDAGKDWHLKLTRFGKNGDGSIKPTAANTVLIIQNTLALDIFKKDSFANREFYGVKPPWIGEKGDALTDNDVVHMKLWVSQKFKFEPTSGIIRDVMISIADNNAFHPIREELLQGPDWDGVNRLDFWLERNFEAKGPHEYLAQVFRKWLVASVTRTFEPGAKFDWMPIFEGPQGVGKSIFGSILFGRKYFSDWLPDLSDKEAALSLQGVRCVEFSELAQFRRSETRATKAFISREVDKVRPPFGRLAIEIYRQCVFYGSTNDKNYLKDETGNRRYMPVLVGKLDWIQLKIDKDQLWAEALFIYQNGLEETLKMEGEASDTALEEQNEKMVITEAEIMREEIEEFIVLENKKPEGNRFPFAKFKLRKLFEGSGPLQKWKDTEPKHRLDAGKALHSLKAKKWKTMGTIFWKMEMDEIKRICRDWDAV